MKSAYLPLEGSSSLHLNPLHVCEIQLCVNEVLPLLQGLGDLDKSPCEDELSKGLAGPRKRGALDTGEEEEEVKKTCV